MKTIKSNNAGFTLTELLISVSIIALITTATVSVYINTVKRARDAKRLSDMADIQVALEAYRADYGVYPEPVGTTLYNDNDCSGWDTSYDGTFIKELVDKGYLTKNLMDPLNDPNLTGESADSATACAGHNRPGFNYFYARYSPSSDWGCEIIHGNYYVLGIGNLEMTDEPSTESPGWACGPIDSYPNCSCPSFVCRDWECAFEWVTGSYDGSK
jgi:prepilin-type N-terminal cleavage/methylation domain-containing protein